MLSKGLLFVLAMLVLVTFFLQSQGQNIVKAQQSTDCDDQKNNTLTRSIPTEYIGIDCATNNTLVLVFPQTFSELGWATIDFLKNKGNYTLDDVVIASGSASSTTKMGPDFYAIMSR